MKSSRIIYFGSVILLLVYSSLSGQQYTHPRSFLNKEFYRTGPDKTILTPFSDTTPGGYTLEPDNQGALDFDPAFAEDLFSALQYIDENNNSKGISAAFMIPGKGMWMGVSGYSTMEPEDTFSYDMASYLCMSTLNSAVLLKLVEEGKLTLDDSIGTYLVDLPENIPASRTIRQVLNYRSGLYNYLTEFPHLKDTLLADPDHLWSFAEITERLVYPPLSPNTPSGYYSGTDDLIVAEIIRQVTDSSLSGQLHKYILDPLDLENISVPPDDELTGRVVHPWNDDIDQWEYITSNAWLSTHSAEGGFGTPEEITRFAYAFHTGGLVSTDPTESMQWDEKPIYTWVWLGKTYLSWGGIAPEGTNFWYVFYPPTGATYAYFTNSSVYTIEDAFLLNAYLKSLPVNSSSETGILYGLASNEGGLLCEASPPSLSFSSTGNTLYTNLQKIKIDPVTGNLWGLSNNSPLGMQLVQINIPTGEAFPRTDIDIPSTEYVKGMAFTPEGEIILALGSGDLYKVDPVTGGSSLVCNAPVQFNSLAIHTEAGSYWAIASVGPESRSRLITINPATGDTTGIGYTGVDKDFRDLSFDASGNLVGISGIYPTQIHYFDASTGTASLLSTVETIRLESLTFAKEAIVEGLREDLPDQSHFVRCYPNPTTNQLFVEFAQPVSPKTTLELMDLTGKVVYSAILGNNTSVHSIDLSALAEGVYFIKISNSEFTLTKRIVKY